MDTFEKISRIVADNTDISPESISPETTLNELGLDSIDLVDLVMEIEEAFSVTIPDEEFEGIKSVSDIVALIENI